MSPVTTPRVPAGVYDGNGESLSKEVGPRGLRVNTISPGPVGIDLWLGGNGVAASVARASGQNPDPIAEHAAADSVTGRFTRPDEIADLVLLLAGDRAGNVTGSNFTIDGGLVTTLRGQWAFSYSTRCPRLSKNWSNIHIGWQGAKFAQCGNRHELSGVV
jgi:hypothetical protein